MRQFLSYHQKIELQRIHKYAKRNHETAKADRIKAILMLNDDYTYEQVAKALLLDDVSIRRYYQRYSVNGVDGLKDNYKIVEGYLSKEQKQKLKIHLDNNTYRRAKDIVEYIKNYFKVTYTSKGVVPLLHKLGFTYKKPKSIPGKADSAKQQAFVAAYEKLKAIKGKDDPIYFMDAMHPHHNVEPAYGWIEKGKTKELRTNTGRKRVNINGALNGETHAVVFREDDSINAQSTIALFKQIESMHSAATDIYIITDNAPYYRSCLVKEYVARSKIYIIFLPAYSPNLNLIERLWGFFRKEVCSHYYDHFAEFRERTHNFLKNILDYKEQLNTLLNQKFEITGKHFLQTNYV